MPKGPKGEKRPADVIGNAVHVMRIATGEAYEECSPSTEKVKPKTAVRASPRAEDKTSRR